RYAIRANHVYILLSAVVNLVFRSRVWEQRLPSARRQQRLVSIGHIMVLIAPAILLAAFIVEGHHPSDRRPLTEIRILAIAVGAFLVAVVGGAGRRDGVMK